MNSSFVIYDSGSILNAYGTAFRNSGVKDWLSFYKVYKSVLNLTYFSFFESAIENIFSGPMPFWNILLKYSLILSDCVLGDISV